MPSKTDHEKILTEEEKFAFVRKSVTWIEGREMMDACFVLNFGYEAPLPWPQVFSSEFSLTKCLHQMRWRLDDNSTHLVPGTHGINTPITSTIVIIAGYLE